MNIFRTEEERDAYQTGYEAGYKASEDEFHASLNTPTSRSRTALPANIRRTLEQSDLPIEVATAIADLCETTQAELNSVIDLMKRIDAFLSPQEGKP